MVIFQNYFEVFQDKRRCSVTPCISGIGIGAVLNHRNVFLGSHSAGGHVTVEYLKVQNLFHTVRTRTQWNYCRHFYLLNIKFITFYKIFCLRYNCKRKNKDDIHSFLILTVISFLLRRNPNYFQHHCGDVKGSILMSPVDGFDPFGWIDLFAITPGEYLNYEIPSLSTSKSNMKGLFRHNLK